ncbi:hypothetical protein BRADI_2g10435v3 [Brachypodium distachyon]|uniref:FAD-binding PCMH-type domain-containing protein n=1 Tax=Brachypodium distachyon TaxID=15368 RepID=A0A0Q3FWW9_BRADI|nr:hypothetical protein BRADI_2g10435v3 [Brachypodium distachyon]
MEGGTPMVLLLGLFLLSLSGSVASPPPDPVACARGGTYDCTVTNAYGSFPDRTICRAASITFPRTEGELVAAAAKRKVKVATGHSHSFPKLACPGAGRGDGALISTERLNRTVSVDREKMLMTVESGMVLRDLIWAAADAGLALPHSPCWYGLTIGGLLATGAHGSSLWGKGSAVHEYVVGMRIVTPAPADKGFVMVRELGVGDPELDAAKVSLGVLGAVSQVTQALQPMFKRSVTFLKRDDSDLAEQATMWGRLYEFGDMGNGLNDYLGFRSNPTLGLIAIRATEELQEKGGDDITRCQASRALALAFESQAYGFANDDNSFTEYPVVGFQHRIQASGTCISSRRDGMINTSCPWDPRIPGLFFHSSGFSIALSNVSAFISDMQQLRDLKPHAFCSIDAKLGVLLRYIRASSAYLGKSEDSIDFDVTYYRSHTEGEPRAHSDVVDELEQMALLKYGAVPHWGKNRNFAFNGAIGMYPNAGKFLKVKRSYDPDEIFSSEWSDQVLGIKGSPVIFGKRCAIEGLCVCSDHSHCTPERPGKVYKEARVCSR